MKHEVRMTKLDADLTPSPIASEMSSQAEVVKDNPSSPVLFVSDPERMLFHTTTTMQKLSNDFLFYLSGVTEMLVLENYLLFTANYSLLDIMV